MKQVHLQSLNSALLESLTQLGSKQWAHETALMTQQHLEKIASKEPFNTPTLKQWLTGLLQFDQSRVSAKIAFSAQEYESIKIILSQLMTLLFKARGSKPTESLKKDFLAIENWIYQYHITCTNIGERMSTVIHVAEQNPYARIANASFENSLHQVLKDFEGGAISKVNWQSLSAEQAMGGFLFHVICLSGITNHNMLYRIATLSITRPEMDDPYSGFLLSKEANHPLKTYERNSKNNRNADSIFRWIPDPVSKKIYELHRTKWQQLAIELNSLEPLIMDFVNYLKSHSPHSQALDHIQNLKQLLKMSMHYQRTTLPSYVWHYLEGTFNTKDLPPQSIERLHNALYEWQDSSSPKTLLGMPFSELEGEVNLFTWAQKMVNALSSNPEARRKLRLEWLTGKYSNKEPLVILLKEWLQWEIDQQTSPAVLSKQSQILLSALIEHYELTQDFLQSDADERIEELSELLCDLPRSKQTTLKQAWHRFHEFLVATGRIAKDQYDSTRQSRNSMNAEYISASEYECIRDLLSKSPAQNYGDSDINLKNKLSLVFTLAYRMGLRRSEVLKLAIPHITIKNGELDLLCVRWWNGRRLKTKSSQRSIPIKDILSDKEYLELKLFVAHRRRGQWPESILQTLPDLELCHAIEQDWSGSLDTNLEHQNPYLFLDNNGDIEKESDVIISKIRNAMGKVISNKTPRFHHLRHACATNLLLMLSANKLRHSQSLVADLYYGNRMQGQCDSELDISQHQDPNLFAQFLEIARKTRETLLSDYQHPYAEIYVCARILGHSSPKTTLGSYIHAVALLSGAYLYERCLNYPEKLQRALFPGNRRTFTRYTSLANQNEKVLKKTRAGRPLKNKTYHNSQSSN